MNNIDELQNNIINSQLDEFRREILHKFILPCYKKDLEELEKNKRFWEKIANACELLTTCFLCLSIIFAAMQKSSINIICSVLALSFRQFLEVAKKQITKKTIKLNRVIGNLGIDKLRFVDIECDQKQQLH